MRLLKAISICIGLAVSGCGGNTEESGRGGDASTPAEAPSFDEECPNRQQSLVTLERWLGNLRGSRA